MKIFDIHSYYFSSSINNLITIEEKDKNIFNKKECKILKFKTEEEKKRDELTKRILENTKSF